MKPYNEHPESPNMWEMFILQQNHSTAIIGCDGAMEQTWQRAEAYLDVNECVDPNIYDLFFFY